MNTCPSNPLKLVYNKLHQLSTEGYTTWCTHVGCLLKSLGMENIWDEQKLLVSVDNFKQLKAGFKNELENCYAQKWIKEINFVRKNILNALTSENINEQYPTSGSVLIDWAMKQGGIKSRVYHPIKGCVSTANPEK